MKINKMLWISALILVLSIPSAFAAVGLFENPWFIFAVNVFIIWIILFILQAFLPKEVVAKAKGVIWIVVFAAAVVIAFFVAGGAGYIWQIGLIAPFLGWIAVNTIIIATVGYFGLGLLGVEPKTNPGKIGMGLLAVFFAVIIALNIGDKWLLDTNNAAALKDYLLGPEDKTKNIGGILRPEADAYRLWIFLTSSLLFVWFFTGFAMPQSDKRLSWALAILLGAILARQGTPLDNIMGMGEAFAIVVIGKQIATGGGISGAAGWLMTIFLVEFIFCTVFKTSKLIQLFITFFNNVSNIELGWGGNPIEWLASFFGKILFFFLKIILKIFSAFAGILQKLCEMGGGHIGSSGVGGAGAGGGGIGGLGGIGGSGGVGAGGGVTSTPPTGGPPRYLLAAIAAALAGAWMWIKNKGWPPWK